MAAFTIRGNNVLMGLYAVEYVYDPHLENLIQEVRPHHRTFLRGLFEDGTLVTSGFLRDAMHEGALLILRAPSARAALALLDGDPFRRSGFILERRVREWTPTFGDLAGDFDTDFPPS